MADYTDIKREIDEKIIPNNNAQLITGEKLNDTLKDMLDAVDETKLDPSEVLDTDGRLKESVLPTDPSFDSIAVYNITGMDGSLVFENGRVDVAEVVSDVYEGHDDGARLGSAVKPFAEAHISEITADIITGDQHSSIEMRDGTFGRLYSDNIAPDTPEVSHVGSSGAPFKSGYIDEIHADKVTAATKVTAHIVETDFIRAANLIGELYYTTADKPTYDEVVEAVEGHIFCYLSIGMDEIPADYVGQRMNEESDMNEVFFLDFIGKKLYVVAEDNTWSERSW